MTTTSGDCALARQLFSEHQDRRLDEGRRVFLLKHLDGCGACREQWRLWTRVFDAVSGERELPAQRRFVAPAEPPGRGAPRRLSLPSWNRGRIAAAAAILLAVTHVAVFEWARRGGAGGGGGSLDPSSLAGVPMRNAPAVEAGFFGQAMRDHVDGADLMVREIANMPMDAGEEARRLVSSKLDLLAPDALIAEAERSGARLGSNGEALQFYLHRWEGFSNEIERGLPAQSPAHVVDWLQDRVERSGLMQVMVVARAAVADAPTGRTWRAAEKQNALQRVRTAPGMPQDVNLYLHAQGELLSADYPMAQASFEAFRRTQRGSRLVPLARYMQAECNRRIGSYDKAMMLLLEDGGAIRLRRPNLAAGDPLASQFLFAITAQPQITQIFIPQQGWAIQSPTPPSTWSVVNPMTDEEFKVEIRVDGVPQTLSAPQPSLVPSPPAPPAPAPRPRKLR